MFKLIAMTNKDIKFPYYSGNIKLTKAIGLISIDQFIRVHKEPSKQTLSILEIIKRADKVGFVKYKRKLKQRLYAFTPAVKIEVGVCRKYENVVSWTGLMQLDFDKISTAEEAIEIKNEIFNLYHSIICCYISPSGKGVKALLKTKVPENAEQYKAMHKAVEKEFEVYGCFDAATRNAVLPLFLSYDENILYRDWSEAAIWTKEDTSKEEKVQLLDKPPTSFISNNKGSSESQYNYEKVIRIFKKAINSINDNGHPQLRTACLILGSRVGAGYIDLNEAISLATYEICSNSYFDKDQNGYVNTGQWAINQGMKNPKYYN